jgi:hypothetical protein
MWVMVEVLRLGEIAKLSQQNLNASIEANTNNKDQKPKILWII